MMQVNEMSWIKRLNKPHNFEQYQTKFVILYVLHYDRCYATVHKSRLCTPLAQSKTGGTRRGVNIWPHMQYSREY